MNILWKLLDSLWNMFWNLIEWTTGFWKIALGFVTVVGILLWSLAQLIVLFANFFYWVGDHFFAVVETSPIEAAFPGGMAAAVAFANALFPITECFQAFSFLASLWLLAATVRTLRGLIPGWS